MFSGGGLAYEVYPQLADSGKHKLAEVLREILLGSQLPRLDIVTAFFNLKGLEALAPEL
jgi:hypothetical protein